MKNKLEMISEPIIKLNDLRQKVDDLLKIISAIEQYNRAVIWFLVNDHKSDESAIDNQLVEQVVTKYITGCHSRNEFVRSPTEFLDNWISKMSDDDLEKVGLKS